MATFSAGSRVKVSSQNSEYRNKLGTVEVQDGDDHDVRLDGFPVGQTRRFLGKELVTTTLASPIDYTNAT